MKAAIYARVSTDQCQICHQNRRAHEIGSRQWRNLRADVRHAFKGQSTGMQTRELLEFCKRRKWEFEVYADSGWSGAKERRPELDRLMVDAKRKRIDVVVVYRFDRFARSLKQLVDALDLFNSLGIQFVSLHEQIDTTTPAGKLQFAIFAAIAEFERELIRERVLSGLDKVRNTCKVCHRERVNHLHQGHLFTPQLLGRPRILVDDETMAKIQAARACGESYRTIAREVGITHDTCRRAFLEAQNAGNGAKSPQSRQAQVIYSQRGKNSTKHGAK
jgi:DNA invertase Pin-like site-specific DNA recombinase